MIKWIAKKYLKKLYDKWSFEALITMMEIEYSYSEERELFNSHRKASVHVEALRYVLEEIFGEDMSIKKARKKI